MIYSGVDDQFRIYNGEFDKFVRKTHDAMFL